MKQWELVPSDTSDDLLGLVYGHSGEGSAVAITAVPEPPTQSMLAAVTQRAAKAHVGYQERQKCYDGVLPP